MLQAGRLSTASGSIVAMRTASWQREPSKWVHFFYSQRADRRNTCDTATGAAIASTSGVTGMGASR